MLVVFELLEQAPTTAIATTSAPGAHRPRNFLEDMTNSS
jgi:hypothetical protein